MAWRIRRVHIDGEVYQSAGDKDDFGAALFAEYLNSARRRRQYQWAGLFILEPGPTGEWACVLQHTRPTT